MAKTWVVLAILLAVGMSSLTVQAADDGHVRHFVVPVDGGVATGLVARPHGASDTLVVITHGYTHTSESHRGHLEGLVARGVYGVAMDFSGPRQGFPLAAGAADTVAATELLVARYGIQHVVLFSVSMGCAVGAMAIVDRPDLFDSWIVSEGMCNLMETWAEAKAVVNVFPDITAAAEIEEETGGTPLTAFDAYAERTAVMQVEHMTGLDAAIFLHALNDGYVPYDQGRQMADQLRALGVPTDFYTIGRGEPGGEGTTITGYAGLQPFGLAGHGSESDDVHTLTRLSWEVTYDFVTGGAWPSDQEVVVDG